MIPIVVGIIPFGLAVGAASASADIPTSAAIASVFVILAGAAQLTAVEMLDAGTEPIAIVISALMLNARLLLYSSALAPWFRGASLRQRLLLALPVIDHMHFICTPRFEQGDLDRRQRTAYYLGAATLPVLTWIAAYIIGLAVGTGLPNGVGLHVAGPLGFAGMLAKAVQPPPAIAAALAAALVAVCAVSLPLNLGIVLAPLAGIAIGARFERTHRRQQAREQGTTT